MSLKRLITIIIIIIRLYSVQPVSTGLLWPGFSYTSKVWYSDGLLVSCTSGQYLTILTLIGYITNIVISYLKLTTVCQNLVVWELLNS